MSNFTYPISLTSMIIDDTSSLAYLDPPLVLA